jgi:hypothetical protein
MIYPSCHSAGGKFIYNISFIMMKLVVYKFKIQKLILQNNYHIKILNLDIGNDMVKLTILFDKNY